MNKLQLEQYMRFKNDCSPGVFKERAWADLTSGDLLLYFF